MISKSQAALTKHLDDQQGMPSMHAIAISCQCIPHSPTGQADNPDFAILTSLQRAYKGRECKLQMLTSPRSRSGGIHSRELSCPELGRWGPSIARDRPARHGNVMHTVPYSTFYNDSPGCDTNNCLQDSECIFKITPRAQQLPSSLHYIHMTIFLG